MDNLVDQIKAVAENGLEDEQFFIVDVKVSKVSPVKISVLLDGDEGVTIENCSKLSRFIANELEEQPLVDGAFTLDVGSPGLDNSLMMTRQYVKNIGRSLKVRKTDGEVIKGQLVQVRDNDIELKLSKKGSQESVVITFDDIDWAKVQVSFK